MKIAVDLLSAALEELLGNDDRDLDDMDGRKPRCHYCGRDFEDDQILCSSDDCMAFQARKLLKEVQS